MSAVLTACLWILQEVVPLIQGRYDGVNHMSHLVGAAVGAYCGYAVSYSRWSEPKGPLAWLQKIVSRKKDQPDSLTKKVGKWLHGD